jgi:hypothetical protein
MPVAGTAIGRGHILGLHLETGLVAVAIVNLLVFHFEVHKKVAAGAHIYASREPITEGTEGWHRGEEKANLVVS